MQPIKAVVCMLHSKYIHSGLAPWYLAAGVQAFGDENITCTVTEGTVNEPLENILERITRECPDVVGFCCYIWNITAVRAVTGRLKERLPKVQIVLGGPEVAFNAADVLSSNPGVGCVLAGEGEKTFPLLLAKMRRNREPDGIPGAYFRKSTGQISGIALQAQKEDPPSPYSRAYFDALCGRIAYIETSRGCPFSCAFCLSGSAFGVRFFDIQRAKNEILLLANSHTKTIKFVDRTFNADLKRAHEIFNFIVDAAARKLLPAGVCFHFEMAGDLFDEEIFALLAAAPLGLFQFEIGIQSFSEETLAMVRRKTDVRILKQNILRLIAMKNIHIHVDLIAGLPLEDLCQFAEGFNTAYSLHPHMLQLGFLKLLHGAEMRLNPAVYPCDFYDAPPYAVIKTPWMPFEAINQIHRAEAALDRLYNKGRFHRTLAYLQNKTQLDAFSLFLEIGGICSDRIKAGISLDGLLLLLYSHYQSKPGISADVLRDMMVCDCLATGRHRQIPAPLRKIREEHRSFDLKKARYQRKQGLRNTLAVRLSAVPGWVAANIAARNVVTGDYSIDIFVVGFENFSAAKRLYEKTTVADCIEMI